MNKILSWFEQIIGKLIVHRWNHLKCCTNKMREQSSLQQLLFYVFFFAISSLYINDVLRQ